VYTLHPSNKRTVIAVCKSHRTLRYGGQFEEMRVFRRLGSIYSYVGPNAVPCVFTDNVIFMENVRKLNIAFHSLGNEVIDND
jgi:hypothetical protein